MSENSREDANLLSHARAMTRRGWAVFPVRGKKPLKDSNGVLDATTDDHQVRRWFKEPNGLGVAIATGEVSGFWALDLDSDAAEDELGVLELKYGELPETVEVKTGRGRHLYFGMNGQPVRNSTANVAPGIHVRGTGGYVVAPPSRHPDGGTYTWTVSPRGREPADAPSWLMELVMKPERSRQADVNPDSHRIPTGTRNDSLARFAGKLRRLGLSTETIFAALRVENQRCDPPLHDDEVRRIAQSIGRYQPGPEVGPEPLPSATVGTTAAEAPDLTDTGNATRLVELHGNGLHYIAPWGKWLAWSDAELRWNLDHRDVRVRELAKDVGKALKVEANDEPDDARSKKIFAFARRSLNAHGISGMVDLARGIHGIPLDHEALDSDGWLLGVMNGCIGLNTGQLQTARPSDLMTLQAPVKWDEDAKAPRWEQALEEWFPAPEVRAYVKRVAGSALVGAQRDHVFVIHYGGGRNGKGTFVRAVFRALGPYCRVIHLSLLVEQKYSQHDTVKAELFRARLAVASETQRRVKLDEANIKNLTGGDRITARRMREDPWEFDPTHSLWLQTNHLPEIGGRDRGIWSRIRVVKWETTFAEEDQDSSLDERLATEAPGILRWLVEGCLEWQQHGLDEPESVIRETLAYRNAEDVFSRFADDVGLAFRPGLEIQAGAFQELLTDWAKGEGIDPPAKEVGTWLRENEARQARQYITDPAGKRKRARYWVGVGINDGNHENVQTEPGK